MRWALGMIGGACVALVLGMAVVAPTASRGAGPVPAPSDWVLADSSSRTGAVVGRSLVELPESAPGSEPGPGSQQSGSPDPDAERLDSTTVREAARKRN